MAGLWPVAYHLLTRITRALQKGGVTTVQQLVDKYEGGSLEVLPQVGPGAVDEVRWALRAEGLIQ